MIRLAIFGLVHLRELFVFYTHKENLFTKHYTHLNPSVTGFFFYLVSQNLHKISVWKCMAVAL